MCKALKWGKSQLNDQGEPTFFHAVVGVYAETRGADVDWPAAVQPVEKLVEAMGVVVDVVIDASKPVEVVDVVVVHVAQHRERLLLRRVGRVVHGADAVNVC